MAEILFLLTALGWPAVWGAVVAKGAGVWLDRWAGRPRRSWGTAALQGVVWWAGTALTVGLTAPPVAYLAQLNGAPATAAGWWAVTAGVVAALHLTATATAAVILPRTVKKVSPPAERSWRAVGVYAAAAAVWGVGAAMGSCCLLWGAFVAAPGGMV